MALEKLSRVKTFFVEFGAVATALATIGTCYFLFMNNIWKPKVELLSVDYENGVAIISVNGVQAALYKNEKYAVGWGWSIQFGTDYDKNVQRVELVKDDATHEVLNIKG